MASSTTFAGGAPIALGLIAGTLIGFFAGETTIGFLVGLGIGVAVAVAIWLRGATHPPDDAADHLDRR